MAAPSCILAYLMLLLAPLASLGQGYISLDIPAVRCSSMHDAWLSYDRTNQDFARMSSTHLPECAVTTFEHTAQRLATSMP